jgi:hypothetical protein
MIARLRKIVPWPARTGPRFWSIWLLCCRGLAGLSDGLWAIMYVQVLSVQPGLIFSKEATWGRVYWLKWFIGTCAFFWVILFALSVGASVMLAGDSLRACSRLGRRGWTRPRWWFELSRLLCIVLQLTLALFVLVLFVAIKTDVGPWMKSAYYPLLAPLVCIGLGFVSTATVGYAVSFVRRLPRRGNAFKITHFYYTMYGTAACGYFIFLRWPPGLYWLDGLLLLLAGMIIVFLVIGLFGSRVFGHSRTGR